MAPAFLISVRAAVIGFGCTAIFSMMPQTALAWRAGGSAPLVLMLECHVSGGGYVIRDAGGHVLENGDGVPLSSPARFVLLITAAPPRVRVTAGVMPHPSCAAGPMLHGLQPVRFTWCQARYEIVPVDVGDYILRSTSSTAMASGPHRGDTMEAFMVGKCHVADQTRSR